MQRFHKNRVEILPKLVLFYKKTQKKEKIPHVKEGLNENAWTRLELKNYSTWERLPTHGIHWILAHGPVWLEVWQEAMHPSSRHPKLKLNAWDICMPGADKFFQPPTKQAHTKELVHQLLKLQLHIIWNARIYVHISHIYT